MLLVGFAFPLQCANIIIRIFFKENTQHWVLIYDEGWEDNKKASAITSTHLCLWVWRRRGLWQQCHQHLWLLHVLPIKDRVKSIWGYICFYLSHTEWKISYTHQLLALWQIQCSHMNDHVVQSAQKNKFRRFWGGFGDGELPGCHRTRT